MGISRTAATAGTILLLLSMGCRGGPSGRTDPDGGDPLDVVPGQVAVRVEAAAWGIFGELVVQVRVANGEGGAPAPLAPSSFNLETTGGAVVSASTDGLGEAACSSAISVAAGAALTCAVVFNPPGGDEPRQVLYDTGEGRQASASVPTCSAAAPSGLCPLGEACNAGVCEAPCSPDHPEGACSEAGAQCRNGECRHPCSIEHRDGFCSEGGCVDGACNADCFHFSDTAEGCFECLGLTGEGLCDLEALEVCASPPECAFCPSRDGNTCDCLEAPACDGCEEAVATFYACVVRECAVCLE